MVASTYAKFQPAGAILGSCLSSAPRVTLEDFLGSKTGFWAAPCSAGGGWRKRVHRVRVYPILYVDVSEDTFNGVFLGCGCVEQSTWFMFLP